MYLSSPTVAMQLIPISNLVMDSSCCSAPVEGDLLLFPKPLPCKLTGDKYKPLIKGDASGLLTVLAGNSAGLDKIKIRSVAEPEALSRSHLEKVILGINAFSWVALMRDSEGQQDVWCRGLPTPMVDQLRFIYQDNLEIADIALGPKGSWFIQARRGGGSHLLWGGEIKFPGDFAAALKGAVTVNSVQFSSSGWIVNFNETSWIWRGLPFRLAERLEHVLSSEDLEISSVTCAPFSESTWLVSVVNLKTGEKFNWHGGLPKSFEADFAKVWKFKLSLGPGNCHFIRDESRTFTCNFQDKTLYSLLTQH